MKLLEAEPVLAPEAAPEAPREVPPEQPASPPEAAPARTCTACGAPMEADQDWCLACGTAAPGRLGERPGWRAATTVVGLTLLLVLGAVGAGYAALTGDANRQAAAPPPPSAAPQTQAQVAPPATASTPTQSTPTQSTPTQSTPAKPKPLPKVHAPTTGTTQGSPVTPAPTSPPSSATNTGTSTGSTPSGTTTTPKDTTTTPADTGPKPIELNGDAGSAYDPYKRAKASGEVDRAIDGDTSTSWYVDPIDPAQIGVGYAVDLGKLQGIREIQLQTSTPGFRMEVYATDETQPPPDILDTRWSHITNVSNVGAKGDGKQKIVLGAGTTKYRNLLLWFTQPPTAGPRLRLTELQLLG